MKKILCIAECCCDLIFAGLPRIPALGEEVYGDAFAIKPGGGANTPISLGRLGAPVTLLTRIGNDDMGKVILEGLIAAHVTAAGSVRTPGIRTPVSAVLSTRQDRCFASYGGTGGAPFPEELLEAAIREADIVHTYLGYCFTYPIAELCREYGRELSLDVSWCDTEDPARAGAVLRDCSWLKVNADEALRLTGCDTPERALAALASEVRLGAVVTLGGDGCIGMRGRLFPEERTVYRFGAVSCGEFRDACGAGDNFAAGMLYGLAGCRTLPQCMELGSRLAGLSVTWYGGNDDTLNCTKIDPAFQ